MINVKVKTPQIRGVFLRYLHYEFLLLLLSHKTGRVRILPSGTKKHHGVFADKTCSTESQIRIFTNSHDHDHDQVSSNGECSSSCTVDASIQNV